MRGRSCTTAGLATARRGEARGLEESGGGGRGACGEARARGAWDVGGTCGDNVGRGGGGGWEKPGRCSRTGGEGEAVGAKGVGTVPYGVGEARGIGVGGVARREVEARA